ncbi:putative transmembrane protein 32 protein [Erysiphe neolycopersici]|uniref:Putative transmembrane protein 32 protein n=1 Tax=Erysiphe neolycopersici TaxID=212602 RepID=A0A420I0K3_9PEZI|nr:putative transmembrane protein 32 protein [Erysiphe neolycopersici]
MNAQGLTPTIFTPSSRTQFHVATLCGSNTKSKMSFISKSLIGLGLLFLAHSCYSAHEHSLLHSIGVAPNTQISKQGAASSALSSLPIDISVETIVAIILTCLGLVLSTPDLEPIQWRVWAGKIEREGEGRVFNSDGFIKRGCSGNPIKALESRPGFVDIRRQRQEFLAWTKNSEEVSKSKNK